METLTDIRKALDMTQAELADALGVTQSAISRMEAGVIETSRRTVLAAKALLAERAINGEF